MSGIPSTGGGAADFSQRLQQAMNRAKGDVGAKASAAADVAAPAAAGAAAPPADAFNDRLATALRQARGEPDPIEDTGTEPAPEQVGGPVGQGDYVVRVGDCTASIAVDSGHFWETIWNDPGNSELKSVRKDPYVLLPGDRMTIPELRRKEEVIAAEKRHRFVRRGAPERLIIVFKVDGKPRENQAYVLTIDGEKFEGTSDPEGRVEIFIPPDANRGKIVFTESGDRYSLDLGKLDPITEVSGVQKRLANLGFYHGSPDGKMNEKFRQAVREYQQKRDLEPTGEVDENTRESIREEHDG